MSWEAVSAVSALLSAFALVLGALFIVVELRHIEKDRYLNFASEIYRTWASEEFLRDQLWLLRDVHEKTWDEYLQAHERDAELIFYRVGSYYNYIGSLMSVHLLDDRLLLPNVAGSALSVWRVIEPILQDLRRKQGNQQIFADFESLLPICRAYLSRRRDGPLEAHGPAPS